MQLTFLGGADEVGASCTLVEIAGRKILVDCGIRMSPRDGDVLPWLAPIQDAGGLDAIILTHAHMDHSGALPVIHSSYPNIPVYMTEATLSIATILLMDSLKIMQMEFDQEGEIPLYPQPAVEQLLASARPVPVHHPIPLFDGDLQIAFYPSGHILGACSVLLEATDGTLLMGGDISVADQVTVPGIVVPELTSKPDMVVMESTYGGRRHAGRAFEEGRLVEQAAEVIARRGTILFPAFAVGRSQEVILILARAMEQKQLPRAPIFVDGMVRAICNTYRSFPALLTPWMRKRIETLGNPFFYDDGPGIPVWDPKKRSEYANQRPGIIVSSSGMLAGGPSQLYARMLAERPESFIAITGYQDEESPGRQVQDVARAGGGMLRLGGENVMLRCGVGTYGLSAHADTQEIVEVLAALQPARVALVHGDRDARPALAQAIEDRGFTTVHLPTIGATIPIPNPGVRRPRGWALKGRSQLTIPGQQQEAFRGDDELPENWDAPLSPPNEDDILAAGEALLRRDGPGRFYTLQEILLQWDLRTTHIEQALLDDAQRLVAAKRSPFKQDKKRPFLYRLRIAQGGQSLAAPGASQQQKKAKAPRPPGQLDANAALTLADQSFPPETGLYRRSSHPNHGKIVLAFAFPEVAQRRYADAIAAYAEASGWLVELKSGVHQGELQRLAEAIVPASWPLRKAPSLYVDTETVVLAFHPFQPPREEIQAFAEACQKFQEDTGFSLAFKGLSLPQADGEAEAGTAPARASASIEAEGSPGSAPGSAPADASASKDAAPPLVSGLAAPAAAPMEINQAYQQLTMAMADAPDPLLKCSLKGTGDGQYIEVAFISPVVGQRYLERLYQLSHLIGWPIALREAPNQHLIKEKVKATLPEGWQLKKEPSFFPEDGAIGLRLANRPEEEAIAAFGRQIEDATGYPIRIIA